MLRLSSFYTWASRLKEKSFIQNHTFSWERVFGEWDTDLSLDLCVPQIYALVTPRTDHLSYTKITLNEVSGEHGMALDNRAQSLSSIHPQRKIIQLLMGVPLQRETMRQEEGEWGIISSLKSCCHPDGREIDLTVPTFMFLGLWEKTEESH